MRDLLFALKSESYWGGTDTNILANTKPIGKKKIVTTDTKTDTCTYIM